jgi:hypothetical protein
VTITRSLVATMATLSTTTKEYALDPSTTNPKYSATQVLRAQNAFAGFLQMHRGMAPTYEDFDYAADSTAVSLPADVSYQTLYQLQDVTDPDSPSLIPWGPVNQAHQPSVKNVPGVPGAVVVRRRWCIVDGETAPFLPRLMIWPAPTRLVSLRAYYFPAPLQAGTLGDNFFLSPQWQQLAALGAARDLRSVHGEWDLNGAMEARFQEWMQLWREQGGHYNGLKSMPRRQYGRR